MRTIAIYLNSAPRVIGAQVAELILH